MTRHTAFPDQVDRPLPLIAKLRQIKIMVELAERRDQWTVASAWKNETYALIDEIIEALEEPAE